MRTVAKIFLIIAVIWGVVISWNLPVSDASLLIAMVIIPAVLAFILLKKEDRT